MVIPILRGGLGNQMFQIANAYVFAKRFGLEWGINYNLSYCPNQGSNATKYKNSLYSKISSTDFQPSQMYIEPRFNFDLIPKMDYFIRWIFSVRKIL